MKMDMFLTAKQARQIVEEADERQFYSTLKSILDSIARQASVRHRMLNWRPLDSSSSELIHYVITNLKDLGYNVSFSSNTYRITW